MSNIYRLSGIGNVPGMTVPVSGGVIDSNKLSAAIWKERLQLEKAILARKGRGVAGIGAVLSAHDYYIDQLAGIISNPGPAPRIGGNAADEYLQHIPNPAALSMDEKRELWYDAIRTYGIPDKHVSVPLSQITARLFNNPDALKWPDLATQFQFYYPELYGKQYAGLEKHYAYINPLLKQNGIDYTLTRAKTGLKAVLSTVAKVVTAPVRLAAKGVLELTLPKAAPNFIYLFINDTRLLEKLPQAVRSKRDKAQRKADFIVKTIGMGRDHFMGIIRNGIMKHVGASPEDYIAAELRKVGISGIGALPFAAIASVGGFLMDLLKKIASLFGKKDPEADADIAPSAEDWQDTHNMYNIAAEVQSQPANKTLIEKLLAAGKTATEIASTIKVTMDEVQAVKDRISPPQEDWRSYPDGSVMDPVTVYAKAKSQTEGGNNTAMLVGLGVLAVLAFKK